MMIKKMAILALITSFAAACATPQKIELAPAPAVKPECQRTDVARLRKLNMVERYKRLVHASQAHCAQLGLDDVKKLDDLDRKIQKELDARGCDWEQIATHHVENLSDLCPGDTWKFAGKSFEFGKSEISELEDPMASRDATPEDDESDRTAATTDHARESKATRPELPALGAVEEPVKIKPVFVEAPRGKMPSPTDLSRAVISMVSSCPERKVVCQGVASAGTELPKDEKKNAELSANRLKLCLDAVTNEGGVAIRTESLDFAGTDRTRGVRLECYKGSDAELFARKDELMGLADRAKQQADEMKRKMDELDRQLEEARKAAEAARKAAAEAKEGLTTKAEKSEISEYVIPPLEKCCQLDAGGFALANTAYASGGAHLGLVIPVGNVLRAQIGGYFGAVTGVGSLGVGGEIEVRYPLVKVDSAVIMLVPKLLYFTDSNDKIKAVRTDYGAGIGVRMEIFSFYLSLDVVGVTYGDQDHNLPGKIDDFPLMGLFRAGFIYPKSDK